MSGVKYQIVMGVMKVFQGVWWKVFIRDMKDFHIKDSSIVIINIHILEKKGAVIFSSAPSKIFIYIIIFLLFFLQK